MTIKKRLKVKAGFFVEPGFLFGQEVLCFKIV